MNLHEIKNFLVLAEKLHFGRASQACNLSPSALTRSIQRMEESVGEALFTRDNRTVSLTAAGEKFRLFATSVMHQWEELQNSLTEGQGVSGKFSIYASVTAVYSLLPDLLESYRALYPDVQLDLRTGSAEESVQQVLGGEIDVSMAALPDPEKQDDRLTFMPLTTTELVFVAPKQMKSPPMVDGMLDLTQTPLVLPRSGLSRDRLNSWLRDHQSQPNIAAEVSGNEGILSMVRLGCGVGIVPELVLERSPFRKDVRKISGAPQLAPYTVGLCTTRKNLKRPTIAALWALAKENSRSTE